MLVFQVFGILSLIHGVSVPWGPFQQHPWPLRHLTGALGCKCSYWHHRENSCWLERTSSRVGSILVWQTKRWRSRFTQGNKLDNQYITYAQSLCFEGFNSSLFTNSGSQSQIKPAKKAHHFFPCYIKSKQQMLVPSFAIPRESWGTTNSWPEPAADFPRQWLASPVPSSWDKLKFDPETNAVLSIEWLHNQDLLSQVWNPFQPQKGVLKGNARTAADYVVWAVWDVPGDLWRAQGIPFFPRVPMVSDTYRNMGLGVENVSEVRGDQLNFHVGRAQTAP